MAEVTNVLLAGIGGQGVLTASEVIAEAAFRQGHDVKKSEVHGMSQRGGGVSSHLRFGKKVFSPLIPAGEVDFLLAFDPEEGEKYRFMLKSSGQMIDPVCAGADTSQLGRMLNTYLVGVVSNLLPIELNYWLEALRHCVKPSFLEANLKVFHQGREFQCLRRNIG